MLVERECASTLLCWECERFLKGEQACTHWDAEHCSQYMLGNESHCEHFKHAGERGLLSGPFLIGYAVTGVTIIIFALMWWHFRDFATFYAWFSEIFK